MPSAGGSFTITDRTATFSLRLRAQPAVFGIVFGTAVLLLPNLFTTTFAIDITGTPDDILARVKKLIPNRWFQWLAPYRDAVLGGLSDLASWGFGLIRYARAQTRLATAYGIWLDILAFDFLGRHLTRDGAPDDTFRALIRATILQERVTRAGMINAVTALTGKTPDLFEPWNTFDTGSYSATPGQGAQYGSMGYGVGRGGYGSMILPAQVFMQIHRGGPSGVPRIGGYSSNVGGYGSGAVEYIGPASELSGVTNLMIEQLIDVTKPTGTTMWIAFTAVTVTGGDGGGGTVTPIGPLLDFSDPDNSQYLPLV